MPFYRKKPVVIEARKIPTYEEFDPEFGGVIEYVDLCCSLAEWCGGKSYMMHDGPDYRYYEGDPGYDHILIPTLEGDMRARPGDYLIKGVQDEFYPCDPAIFEQTYEAVE